MEPLLVVAIGPDDPGHLTLEAADALTGAGRVLLRTGRHGVTKWLASRGLVFSTLDALYDAAGDFDELNARAAEAVQREREADPSLCYAVPDPLTDATIAALKARGVPLRVISGVTLADLMRSSALETELPGEDGAVCLSAPRFLQHRIDPSLPLLVTEVNSRLLAGEVKLRLLDVYAPDLRVLFGNRVIALEALDRQARYDHLSAVYLPAAPLSDRSRYTFGDLLSVMARLRRADDGCPWDREQTHQTLREYLIEEAYEVVEAIDSGDDERIADELGDVLLQVVFHAQVGAEHGTFGISDVTTAICRKMITRHAHIFGDVRCDTAEDVIRSWEAIKKKEKGLRETAEVMRDVPGHLPALMRASKVQKKARQVGFDWDNPGDALEKVREEADEVREELGARRDPEAEIGDLLFAAVNVARLCGVQPELALSAATEKFIRRFERMERAIAADGKKLAGMTLPEMDAYWNVVKRTEKEGV